MPITPRQREILRAMVVWMYREGCAATIRELCVLFGIAPNGAVCYIDALRRKDYLSRLGRARQCRRLGVVGLRLVPMDEERLIEALGQAA